MSRVGKAPISIPAGVEVSFKDGVVAVKGKLGELQQTVSDSVELSIEDNTITVSRKNDEKQSRADHGLYRALINNMVIGVSEGFEKKLELVGVGYRATNQGQLLDLSLGYSHNIVLEVPQEVKIETVAEKGKNPIVILKSHDKQLVGMVAAKIRSFRKPEPYKGKGVRFVGEYIRRKAGKTASK
ncbi:50S ribosomal protein L6 [Croceimicrobium hydrocarbonivorans]|uniref:Large ribosomal subunit protein uL6 n=1 Tax=Croceimicrobium hydrocarbonivorans TaxID=2761580 RepID=A0A7H0VCA3_9FLAO|nr:50S ribosomal protein L6 [Croceimicrobium hydrocarbonivorans]QNR23351.1 50S ribosomal protein L6 [Croceimicrobium hydrocarbonivorans]